MFTCRNAAVDLSDVTCRLNSWLQARTLDCGKLVFANFFGVFGVETLAKFWMQTVACLACSSCYSIQLLRDIERLARMNIAVPHEGLDASMASAMAEWAEARDPR